MHNGDWNHGWDGGSWWLMALMMVVFWGGLIVVAVTLVRHSNRTPQPHAPEPSAAPPSRQTPQEVLAERLARGEIEPDDYRQRLDALNHQPKS
jgi:putative membrane protein